MSCRDELRVEHELRELLLDEVDALVERDHDRDVRLCGSGAELLDAADPTPSSPAAAAARSRAGRGSPSAPRRARARGPDRDSTRSRAAERSRTTAGPAASRHSPSAFSISTIHPSSRWLGPSSSTKQTKPGALLARASRVAEVGRDVREREAKCARCAGRRARPPATRPRGARSRPRGRSPSPPGRRTRSSSARTLSTTQARVAPARRACSAAAARAAPRAAVERAGQGRHRRRRRERVAQPVPLGGRAGGRAAGG